MDNLKLLKLIALFLVIIGHCTNQYNENWILVSSNKSSFYKLISLYVNSIHMQIFVFISGAVYAYCKSKKKYYKSYSELIIDKFKRLIVPYIFIGVFFMIPIGIIKNVILYKEGFFNSIKNLLLGINGGHLWFLMMLFEVFLIYYLVEKIFNNISYVKSISVLILFQFIGDILPNIFFLSKVASYIIFFHLGYLVYLNLNKIRLINNINKKSSLIIVTFITEIFLVILLLKVVNSSIVDMDIRTKEIYIIISDFIAILGIMQMYFVVILIKRCNLYKVSQRYIEGINKYNFNIYLLHEPIIFMILTYILNLNPTFTVVICFVGAIVISIIISRIYYLVIKTIKMEKK